ncbi:RNA pseudouridine synthase [Halomonas chromatireducens]|uniref:Dual-specificity RNA pseudouridine synthase RluF n=1 Tax=Halomonas chromatireducens TaxID=507626 RepID=A0A109ULF5_9GAMM|nr:RNA pseudouridine synthase [Halomonas chromatireducens]AMD00414.1 Ribosomal large subunit pseudouridine synthase F [Halomonas chromatireducens]
MTAVDNAAPTPSTTERLSKRLARQLPCSRREAELYIAGGWVMVDGDIVEEPQFKVGEERVELRPGARANEIPPVTLLLNAPPGLAAGEEREWMRDSIAPGTHWLDDPAGLSPLKAHFRGLQPMLPLEKGSSGLLVVTQDRRVVRRLDEDTARLEQEVVVEVDGTFSDEQLEALRGGNSEPGRKFAPCKVSRQSETHLRFAVKGMVPGQIEAMCSSVGLTVLSLKRLRIGGVSLGRVPPGQWRYLKLGERF